jgi:hypothetical protein
MNNNNHRNYERFELIKKKHFNRDEGSNNTCDKSSTDDIICINIVIRNDYIM